MDFGGGRRTTAELFNPDALYKRARSLTTAESCSASYASPAAGSASKIVDENDFGPASISKSVVHASCATTANVCRRAAENRFLQVERVKLKMRMASTIVLTAR